MSKRSGLRGLDDCESVPGCQTNASQVGYAVGWLWCQPALLVPQAVWPTGQEDSDLDEEIRSAATLSAAPADLAPQPFF